MTNNFDSNTYSANKDEKSKPKINNIPNPDKNINELVVESLN